MGCDLARKKETHPAQKAGVHKSMIGEPNPRQAEMDDLSAMEDQLARPREQEPSKRVTSLPKVERKKKASAKETQEEIAARVSLAKSNARTIVSTIEAGKKIVAEQVLGLSWDGAKITTEEEADLVNCLTRYLESVGWDLSNPKVGLAVLILTEARITARQYATLKGLLPKDEKAKDAVAK